jgi:hypothetical protein
VAVVERATAAAAERQPVAAEIMAQVAVALGLQVEALPPAAQAFRV